MRAVDDLDRERNWTSGMIMILIDHGAVIDVEDHVVGASLAGGEKLVGGKAHGI